MIDGFLYQIGCMIVFFAVLLVVAAMPVPVVRDLQLDNTKVAKITNFLWLVAMPFLVFSLPLRLWGGQTVGKKILGIKVVDSLEHDLSWVQCLARPASYILSMIGLLGFLWSLWDKEKRCWHDFIARTRVVRLS